MTVVKTAGSVPRDAGAKMIWRPASPPESGFAGTVGGGRFELLVLESAQKHFNNRSCGLEKFVLSAESEQCCGGTVEVFFEFHGPSRRVVVFGAGHVSGELAGLLDDSGLEVVIVDDRAEWNNAARFSRARRVMDWDEGVRLTLEQPEATLACVLTCSHETDFDVVKRLLSAERSPGFLGLIGSRSKRACFFHRLAGAGLGEAALARVKCPIGVGDTGKTPRQVAISIAAQVLMEAGKLGVL